jgi:hypothetical protein
MKRKANWLNFNLAGKNSASVPPFLLTEPTQCLWPTDHVMCAFSIVLLQLLSLDFRASHLRCCGCTLSRNRELDGFCGHFWRWSAADALLKKKRKERIWWKSREFEGCADGCVNGIEGRLRNARGAPCWGGEGRGSGANVKRDEFCGNFAGTRHLRASLGS